MALRRHRSSYVLGQLCQSDLWYVVAHFEELQLQLGLLWTFPLRTHVNFSIYLFYSYFAIIPLVSMLEVSCIRIHTLCMGSLFPSFYTKQFLVLAQIMQTALSSVSITVFHDPEEYGQQRTCRYLTGDDGPLKLDLSVTLTLLNRFMMEIVSLHTLSIAFKLLSHKCKTEDSESVETCCSLHL